MYVMNTKTVTTELRWSERNTALTDPATKLYRVTEVPAKTRDSEVSEPSCLSNGSTKTCRTRTHNAQQSRGGKLIVATGWSSNRTLKRARFVVWKSPWLAEFQTVERAPEPLRNRKTEPAVFQKSPKNTPASVFEPIFRVLGSVLRKKGPQKWTQREFLNKAMWCRLFFQTNSAKVREFMLFFYGRWGESLILIHLWLHAPLPKMLDKNRKIQIWPSASFHSRNQP